MWDWIITNKEWLFSGIGFAAPVAICGWLWPKKGKNKGQSEAAAPSTASVQQTHSGSGDNVAGNKNVNG